MSSVKPALTTYRAHLVTDRDRADRIAALLSELLWPPADAVGVFEAGEAAVRVEAYFADRPDQKALQALLEKHFDAQTASALAIEPITSADWVGESQAKRPAIAAGRFLIHGRHERARIGRRAYGIEIEAAQAFGTGHHGSTTGCLLALDRLLKRRRFRSIVGVGTGTGVLAIAVAKARHRPVLASDIDAQAVDIALENASLNGVGALVSVVRCAGFDHAAIRRRAPFDLIAANILARPLADLAPAMARFSFPGGMVVLSGITHQQAAPLAARYLAFGFVLVDKLAIEDWATLTLRRQRH